MLNIRIEGFRLNFVLGTERREIDRVPGRYFISPGFPLAPTTALFDGPLKIKLILSTIFTAQLMHGIASPHSTHTQTHTQHLSQGPQIRLVEKSYGPNFRAHKSEIQDIGHCASICLLDVLLCADLVAGVFFFRSPFNFITFFFSNGDGFEC